MGLREVAQKAVGSAFKAAGNLTSTVVLALNTSFAYDPANGTAAQATATTITTKGVLYSSKEQRKRTRLQDGMEQEPPIQKQMSLLINRSDLPSNAAIDSATTATVDGVLWNVKTIEPSIGIYILAVEAP